MTSTLVRVGKWLAGRAIDLYVWPLTWNERLRHYAKGSALVTGFDHLHRAVRCIQAHGTPRPDSVIVDVGASGGGISSYLRHHFSGLRILAFEPNPIEARHLEARMAGCKDVVVKAIALGPRAEEAVLHVTANSVSSSLNPLDAHECSRLPGGMAVAVAVEREVTVQVSTLDAELHDAPSILLLKLDTQGTELGVLQGAEQTLKRTRFVLVEMNNHQMYHGTCQYYEVDEYLRSKGFRLADVVVSYQSEQGTSEYDALYQNVRL